MRRLKLFLALLASPILLGAAHVGAQAVTQSFNTDTALQRGMVVRLSDKDKSKVVPLTYSLLPDMKGVVVAATDAPVTLSSSSNSRQVFVATSGHYDVLVSNQSGVIHNGDYVSISSLDGVAMKADPTQAIVLGKALGDFTASTSSGTAKLKNEKGQNVSVSVGLLPVDITIARNPSYNGGSYAPAFLKNAAESLAGKPVNAVKIYSGVLILIVTVLVAGSILYGGVRSGLIAIGRNPLAKVSIMRSLLQVVLASLIILISGLAGGYLLLKL